MKIFFKSFLKHFFFILSISLITTVFSLEIPTITEYKNPILNIAQSPLKFLHDQSPKNIEFLSSSQDNIQFIDGKSGFNSYTQNFANAECYNVSRIITGSMKIEGTLSSSLNKKGFYDSLNFSAGAKLGIANYGIGAELNIENIFSENSNTSSYYYYVKYSRTRIFKYDPLVENVLTESGYKVYNLALTKKDQRFYNYCGNSLVRNVEEGGIIIIQVKIEFESEYKKSQFDWSGNLNLGNFFGISGAINTKFEKFNLSGKLSFKGVQLGGDSSKFFTMFPKNTSEKCANAVDPRKSKEYPNSKKECTEFLNDINDYINNKFQSQFPSGETSSDRYYVFKFEQSLLEGLVLPEFNNENTILNKMKNKFLNFKKVNDYYLSNMNRFKESYIFFTTLDIKFSDKFTNYLDILTQNDFNLMDNVFGVFRFNDCWGDTRKCTELNFDNAYSHLKNIFKEIDNYMLEMRYVWDYYIKLSDCGVGLSGGEIGIRIYPQANEKYGIIYVRSNLNNSAVFPKGWDWMNGHASTPNNFEFQVHPVLGYKAKATPIGKSDSLNVRVKCCITSTDNVGYKVENPYYFNSQPF